MVSSERWRASSVSGPGRDRDSRHALDGAAPYLSREIGLAWLMRGTGGSLQLVWTGPRSDVEAAPVPATLDGVGPERLDTRAARVQIPRDRPPQSRRPDRPRARGRRAGVVGSPPSAAPGVRDLQQREEHAPVVLATMYIWLAMASIAGAARSPYPRAGAAGARGVLDQHLGQGVARVQRPTRSSAIDSASTMRPCR